MTILLVEDDAVNLFGQMLLDAPVRAVVVGLVSAVLAWLPFHLYEVRFLRLKRHFSR